MTVNHEPHVDMTPKSWKLCWHGTAHIHNLLLVAKAQHTQQHASCNMLFCASIPETVCKWFSWQWVQSGTETGAREEGRGLSGEERMVVCDAGGIRLD